MTSLSPSKLFIFICCIALIGCPKSAARIIPGSFEPEAAASSDHHYGRVHIKVFRGPSHDHHFAPHGYWVKQPADDEHHR